MYICCVLNYLNLMSQKQGRKNSKTSQYNRFHYYINFSKQVYTHLIHVIVDREVPLSLHLSHLTSLPSTKPRAFFSYL